jgi:hypothetical protein
MIARINRRPRKKRIVILGGGFGGVYAAMYLEKLLARRSAVEICLVSHDNFFFSRRCFTRSQRDLDLPNKRVLISRGYRDHSQQVDYDHLANPKVE